MIKNPHAFTLVEIIAVISLISIVLLFAAPKMDGLLFGNNSREVSKWIVLNVADLKDKSVQMQKTFVLTVDMDDDRLRISDSPGDGDDVGDVMDKSFSDNEIQAQAAEKKFDLPQGYRVNSVLFSQERRITNGEVAIGFYPEGYSDRAIIHLTDRQNRKTSYTIEAFLQRVTIHDDHVGF